MIQITPHMNILVAIAPVDFRKGIDGLAALCKHSLNVDPFSGTLFVFTNKSRKALRIVSYDGQGFWMCHKRLSKGRFKWEFQSDGGKASSLGALQLQQLLWNLDPIKSASIEEFRCLPKKLRLPSKSAGHGQKLLI